MTPEAEKPCACRAYSASVCARLQHGLKPWTNKAAGWGHFGCWLAHQLDRLWTGDCTPCKRCGSGTYGVYK